MTICGPCVNYLCAMYGCRSAFLQTATPPLSADIAAACHGMRLPANQRNKHARTAVPASEPGESNGGEVMGNNQYILDAERKPKPEPDVRMGEWVQKADRDRARQI